MHHPAYIIEVLGLSNLISVQVDVQAFAHVADHAIQACFDFGDGGNTPTVGGRGAVLEQRVFVTMT